MKEAQVNQTRSSMVESTVVINGLWRPIAESANIGSPGDPKSMLSISPFSASAFSREAFATLMM